MQTSNIENKKLRLISIIFASLLAAVGASPGYAQDYSAQFCEKYEARRASQARADADAAMHDRIINLCGQPYFDRVFDDFKKTWGSAVDGFMFNPKGAVERFHHKLLSQEVYEIVNYPGLARALDDCYPGDKFKQMFFIDQLQDKDRQTMMGAVAGVAAQVGVLRGGGLVFAKIVGTAKAIKIWTYLYPTLMTVYALAQWSHVPTGQAAPPQRVPNPNTTDPIIERISSAKATVTSEVAPTLFAQVSEPQMLDEFQNIPNFLRYKANNCLSSVEQYLKLKALGKSDTEKMIVINTCRNYISSVRDGLERLKKTQYACEAANRVGTQAVLADFDQFVSEFPRELLNELK